MLVLRRTLAIAFFGSAGLLPLSAQDSTFADFYACDVIAAPQDRLACFDAVLKKQKLIRGLSDGSAASAARPSYPAAVPRADVRSAPLSSLPEVNRTGGGNVTIIPGRAPGASDTANNAVPPTRSSGRTVASVDALPKDFETVITGFNANSAGSYRLRISEGIVFESAGGQKPRGDLSNKSARIYKNFLGQWRMEVDGISGFFNLRPVRP